ncbi:unnamed protein product, partial [Prorocentrum cordatum]
MTSSGGRKRQNDASQVSICLASAVLRWGDIRRSWNLGLTRDALCGTSYRMKWKTAPTPWAALRHDACGRDWGGAWHELTRALTPESGPGQRGMALAGGVQDTPRGRARQSPRFYMPAVVRQFGGTCRGQVAAVGRWADGSQVPLQRDRARCCPEQLVEAQVLQALRNDFWPAGSFEVLQFGGPRDVRPPPGQLTEGVHGDRKAAPGRDAEAAKASAGHQGDDQDRDPEWILSARSAMLHRERPSLTSRSPCPCARSYEGREHCRPVACGSELDAAFCASCFGTAKAVDMRSSPENCGRSEGGAAPSDNETTAVALQSRRAK